MNAGGQKGTVLAEIDQLSRDPEPQLLEGMDCETPGIPSYYGRGL